MAVQRSGNPEELSVAVWRIIRLMKRMDEDSRKRIMILTISGLIIATACFAFMNISSILSFLGSVWNAMGPFVWGFCIAFVLVPIQRMFEKWMANLSLSAHTKRVIAVSASVVVFLLIIVVFFMVLIPQLVNSFESLADSMDGYWESFQKFLQQFGNYEEIDTTLQSVYETLRDYLLGWVRSADIIVKRLVTYSLTFVRGVLNFLIGIIVAVYLMIDQERWKGQVKKLAYALLPIEHAENLFYVGRLTSKMLDSFVFGKALDSLIVGIACGICCGLMKIPYTPLIAFIVGITNMIPVFGPFIGAVPCVFILLIISPAKALEFGIFILILQQIDGNILGPYILGDSLGLPPVWVMFAIIVGGALWGVLGMFLGVPLFSVIYVLVSDFVRKRLREKHIRVES